MVPAHLLALACVLRLMTRDVYFLDGNEVPFLFLASGVAARMADYGITVTWQAIRGFLGAWGCISNEYAGVTISMTME